jgi:hypothetical protein
MKALYTMPVLLGLAACVQRTWVPGPQATAPFGMASGQCQMMALNGYQPVAAAVPPSQPAVVYNNSTSRNVIQLPSDTRWGDMGAGLGNGIATGIRSAQMYNSCMQAQGYVRQ